MKDTEDLETNLEDLDFEECFAVGTGVASHSVAFRERVPQLATASEARGQMRKAT